MRSFVVDATARYSVEIREPRQRNWSEAERQERVPVRIGVVSGTEAPVAIRVSTAEMSDKRGRDEASWPMIELRLHEGHLYAPVGTDVSNSWHAMRDMEAAPWTAPPRSDRELQERLEGQEGELDVFGNLGYRLPVVKDGDVARLRDMLDPKRAGAIAELHARASSLLVIDGVLCERMPEPCWTLTFDRFSSMELKWSNEFPVRGAPENSYRLDRFDEALARFQEGGGRDMDRIRGESEVLLPDCLRFSPEPEAILRAAIYTVRSWDKEQFLNAGPEEMAGWAALRDQVALSCPDILSHYRDVSRDMIAATHEQAVPIAAALEAMLPGHIAVARRCYQRIGMQFSAEGHHTVRPALEALSRWRTAVSVLEQDGPGLSRA